MSFHHETERITDKLNKRPNTEQTDLVKWVNSFLTAKRAEGLATRTIGFYRDKLSGFVAYAEKGNVATVEGITADLLRQFMLHLEETHHKPGGIHAFYRCIRVFIRWYENEVEPDATVWRNPLKRVKAPKVPVEALEPVDLADVAAMVKTCHGERLDLRDKAILLTLVDTGVRATELCNLDLADLDLATGSLTVRQGKGRKPRIVFAGQTTRKALRAYLRVRGSADGPLFLKRDRARLEYDGLRELVKERALKANVERPALHAFRRAFALNMLRNGCDLLTLQRLMGHADLSLLRRYAKQTTDDLRQVHAASSPVDRLNR